MVVVVVEELVVLVVVERAGPWRKRDKVGVMI